MIASLPWYDFPELREATDAFWENVAVRLRRAGLAETPLRLSRNSESRSLLSDRNLLLTQVCGWDVAGGRNGALAVVGALQFNVSGCSLGKYRSFVVVRKDSPYRRVEDLRGASLSVNEIDSHSGVNCLRPVVAPFSREGRFFGDIRISGSHEASLEMIASGKADAAAIDCVTFSLLERHRPHAIEAVRALSSTPEAPAPPVVTRADLPTWQMGRLRWALSEAARDPGLEKHRLRLSLAGFGVMTRNDYEPLLELQRRAVQMGYCELDRLAA